MGYWQREIERGAFSRLGIDLDFALVALDDAFADCQADASILYGDYPHLAGLGG